MSLTSKSFATGRPLKDKDESLLVTAELQLRRWRERFIEVLRNTFGPSNASLLLVVAKDIPQITRVDTSPPSKLEVTAAIKSMDVCKAPWIDGIPVELIKADTNVTADILLPLMQEYWKTETLPKDWKKGVIIKILDNFCYLGSVVTADGGAAADVQSRINNARAAFFSLTPFRQNNKISRRTQLRIFETNVKSVAVHLGR